MTGKGWCQRAACVRGEFNIMVYRGSSKFELAPPRLVGGLSWLQELLELFTVWLGRSPQDAVQNRMFYGTHQDVSRASLQPDGRCTECGK